MTNLFGTSPSPDHVSLRGPHLSIGRPSCGGEYHRRARCGKTARRDLCGGCRVTGSPTAIRTGALHRLDGEDEVSFQASVTEPGRSYEIDENSRGWLLASSDNSWWVWANAGTGANDCAGSQSFRQRGLV